MHCDVLQRNLTFLSVVYFVYFTHARCEVCSHFIFRAMLHETGSAFVCGIQLWPDNSTFSDIHLQKSTGLITKTKKVFQDGIIPNFISELGVLVEKNTFIPSFLGKQLRCAQTGPKKSGILQFVFWGWASHKGSDYECAAPWRIFSPNKSAPANRKAKFFTIHLSKKQGIRQIFVLRG